MPLQPGTLGIVIPIFFLMGMFVVFIMGFVFLVFLGSFFGTCGMMPAIILFVVGIVFLVIAVLSWRSVKASGAQLVGQPQYYQQPGQPPYYQQPPPQPPYYQPPPPGAPPQYPPPY